MHSKGFWRSCSQRCQDLKLGLGTGGAEKGGETEGGRKGEEDRDWREKDRTSPFFLIDRCH